MRLTQRSVRLYGIGVLALALGGLSGCGTASHSLAVADFGNNRVLIYQGSSPVTDQAADVVLGQPDFTSNLPDEGGVSFSANSFSQPIAVAQDSNGNLFVSDFGFCRILEFKPPFRTNMNASVVIGQADFTSGFCTGSSAANALFLSYGMTVDRKGNLWATDFENSRVLEFTPPFSNGMSATLALGQAGVNSSAGCNRGAAGPDANTLCNPVGVSFDANGNLWVGDIANNRILEYVPPFSTGMAATLELGHPAGASAFTSNTGNDPSIFAGSLNEPQWPRFDKDGNLWVTDPGNSRVLKYVPPFSNGMNASTVVGQADFISNGGTGGISSSISFPWDIAFEENGNMVVSDNIFSRVMVFNPPFSNGMNASSVLGQPDINSTGNNQGGGPTAKTLAAPSGLAELH